MDQSKLFRLRSNRRQLSENLETLFAKFSREFERVSAYPEREAQTVINY